jgi:RimJ/RimL family protein N-acetyltransferase
VDQATLSTARLVLRPPVAADAEAIFSAYATDERVTRYLAWTPRRSIDEVAEFLADPDRPAGPGSVVAWVIVDASTDAAIGMISARRSDHVVEIGYVLAQSRWGNGLMTEAVTAVVESFVADPSVYRVWAIHDIDNPASGRVMEKAGLRREGVLRRWAIHPNVSDEPRDVVAYSWSR